MSDRKPWEETWEVGPAGIETENRIPVLVDEFGVFENADARLAAAAPELVRALLEVEWVDVDIGEGDAPHYVSSCPWCFGYERPLWIGHKDGHGHAPDCARQAALRKAGVIE